MMKPGTKTKLILGLHLLWVIMLTLIGSWWMYLIITFGKLASQNGIAHKTDRLVNMLLWEGSSFFGIMFLLSAGLITLYWKDIKKTEAMQAFFASLTHELKTPLASIRLQGEVIHERSSTTADQKLKELTDRLIEDTAKLENQMDKVLQLSRLERGGDLNLSKISLSQKIKALTKKERGLLEIKLNFNQNERFNIVADEFALDIIIKNLLENTKNHARVNSENELKRVEIKLSSKGSYYLLDYLDSGEFRGVPNRIGELFYKVNSKKGSGIGLYLVKKLTEKMKGKFELTDTNPFNLRLSFPMDRSHLAEFEEEAGDEDA